MAGVLASPTKRCPPGLNCGVGPVCTVDDCDVEDCASAPVCQKRGLETKRCPPGLFCGVGPVCTVDDCGVEDCASAPVCQKRGLESVVDKVKRKNCPQICNIYGVCGCALETATMTKRAPTPVFRPCPDICNEDGVCGCALESLISSPSMVKRDPTAAKRKVCPDICNEDGLCGCALESALATAKP